MKPRLLLFLVWFGVGTAGSAEVQPDILLPLANAPKVPGEFSRCLPLDWNAVAQNWDYLIRYHSSNTKGGESVSLFLVREDNKMILTSIDFTKVSFKAFDTMDRTQKLAAASRSAKIDVELAQAIYSAWVRALLASQAAGAQESTTSTEFYLSAYGIDTGYMCASTQTATPNATTGRIVEIARLLEQYLEAGPEKGRPLREQIANQCREVGQRG